MAAARHTQNKTHHSSGLIDLDRAGAKGSSAFILGFLARSTRRSPGTIADRTDQPARYNCADFIPAHSRCLPLRGSAVVFQRDRISFLSESIECGKVRISYNHPHAPIVGRIRGYVVEKLIVGNESSLFLFFPYGDLVAHYVLIESSALAGVDLHERHAADCRRRDFDIHRLRRDLAAPQNNETREQDEHYDQSQNSVSLHLYSPRGSEAEKLVPVDFLGWGPT